MPNECAIDSRPAPDATICPSCLQQLLGELRRIPDLVDELHVTLTRQARTGDRNGPRSTERPLPYDHNASVDLETLRDTLQFWADQVAERRSLSTPYGAAPELARWLTMFPSDLAGLEAAADLHDQIVSAVKAAERTIDRRPDRKFVGPCDAHGADHLSEHHPEGCGEDMYAHLNARTITCRTDDCGAVYEVEQRRAWLLEAATDQLRTAKQLSDELYWVAGVRVTDKLINMWCLRGKLTAYLPHAQDKDRARRFRLGEVLEVAVTQAQQAQAKRINVSGAA